MTKAIAYYKANAHRFPSGVITAIAGKLGLSNTTEIDQPMMDAIAGYQEAHGLSPVDGQAGKDTLTEMFGRDIRMADDAADESMQRSSDGMTRVFSGVTVTEPIQAAWAILLPLLPESVYMTSGLRTWEKTVEILVGLVQKKAPRMIEKGLTTQEEIDTAIAQQDFGTLHRLGNLDYDGKEWAVAGPGNSPHVTGYAFDISGADIGAMDAIVHKTAADNPEFGKMFKGTIPETGNNCVHIDLVGSKE
jgi:hypothetical protein